MNLDNPYEVIIHYLLIGEMTFFSHQNGFPMVSTLICMITHWIGLMVDYDINYQVVMILLCYYAI